MSEDVNLNILDILPHRYPMLLVDRIVDIVEDKKITAIKNVTYNEGFFQGHFPGKSVMPGVLIVEAMAQAGAVLVLSKPENKGKIPFFAGIDSCRFRRPVVPGDQLYMEIEVIKFKGHVGKCRAKARVEDEVVCEGELMFVLER